MEGYHGQTLQPGVGRGERRLDSGLKEGEEPGIWSLKGQSVQCGGPVGQRDAWVHPCPWVVCQPWALPGIFFFRPMLQTILAQLLSDMEPSFGIWFWCVQSLPSGPTLDCILVYASP